jgi:uncharacterized OsmC-like protein
MEIKSVTRVGEGKTSVIEINGYKIITEPGVAAGGSGQYPPATTLIIAALVNCMFANVKAYVAAQNLPLDDLVMEFNGNLTDDGIYDKMELLITLPGGFPEERKDRLGRVIDKCGVKKIAQNLPEITWSLRE